MDAEVRGGGMTDRAAVILAAGHGTRMKSPTPKVLHAVGSRAMVDRAVDAAEAAGCTRIIVVAGTHSPEVADHVARRLGRDAVAVQDPPLGTGHAVLSAQSALEGFVGDILVTYADTPLLDADAFKPLFDARVAGADLAVLGFEAADAGAYGRLLFDAEGRLSRIVEAKDAAPEELSVRACNSGVLVAPAALLFELLSRVANHNAKGEYYLTDIVGIATTDGRRVEARLVDEAVTMGVNSQAELAAVERAFQAARRAAFMDTGVTLIAPETVHFAWDTAIAPGVVIEPYVVFGGGVQVEAGAVIKAFSHLEGAHVRSGARIGPYSRLRPGADIGADAHIGNFVEVKNTAVGEGAKANHLAYLGDGAIGAHANIGAGTIFCNYDGFHKHRTEVGEGAFVGSNTALVAPVRVGAGAYVGSGSVITADVTPHALAFERGPQLEKVGWAAKFRARHLDWR